MKNLKDAGINTLAIKYSKVPKTRNIKVEWISINGKRYNPTGTFVNVSDAIHATWLMVKRIEDSKKKV